MTANQSQRPPLEQANMRTDDIEVFSDGTDHRTGGPCLRAGETCNGAVVNSYNMTRTVLHHILRSRWVQWSELSLGPCPAVSPILIPPWCVHINVSIFITHFL